MNKYCKCFNQCNCFQFGEIIYNGNKCYKIEPIISNRKMGLDECGNFYSDHQIIHAELSEGKDYEVNKFYTVDYYLISETTKNFS